MSLLHYSFLAKISSQHLEIEMWLSPQFSSVIHPRTSYFWEPFPYKFLYFEVSSLPLLTLTHTYFLFSLPSFGNSKPCSISKHSHQSSPGLIWHLLPHLQPFSVVPQGILQPLLHSSSTVLSWPSPALNNINHWFSSFLLLPGCQALLNKYMPLLSEITLSLIIGTPRGKSPK